ncbi:dihydrofolate reductase family protein [Stackebrandtia nassauensis]|uniref:Bifunctional deaminase-reductase domain protein n=1 Tax=Stackebrandtia nassauensis (strain DSM 44728 / CIP 108903 / NRRL B-16338 / NBRC 102104 / LLR-40K-21) TaxID=446470 RepID=D3Q2X9_STANL|nr:dihydrofolate reductase family protein [Stackebrandtia nassauensis]ADD39949.1 bifunctional deaminase-reductase domain protein [Stackebrandtia nassauensis DSM 44728]
MARLVYSAIMSLDGYIADENGEFGWAMPSDEVHGFINDRMRSIGTHLYGRVLYETMTGWETDPSLAEQPLGRDFAEQWQAADKIVYSTTLDKPVTAKTRIEREFDPVVVQGLKDTAEADLLIGGPVLAAHAFAAGLVDVCELYVVPVIVGGGHLGLPEGLFLNLELLEERRFANGFVLLRYKVG